jgi:hypothetical protein
MERYKPKQEKQPIKAIREHCIECIGGRDNNPSHTKLIADCPSPDCSLFAFRFGKNPYHRRNLTNEQRKSLAEQAMNSPLIQQATGKKHTNLNDNCAVDT